MSWSYRICKEEIKGKPGYKFKYSIKEVFTSPKRHTVDDIAAVSYLDNIDNATEGECIEDIRKQLTMMLMDTYKPVYIIK